MIEIKSISGEVLLSVPILKDAISHEELMTSDYVQLSWDSEKGDVLPMGAHVEYEGETYSLLEPYHPTRQNEVAYRYTPQFHSRIMRWQKIIVPVYSYNEDGVTVKSRELDWTFTGTPADAMYMVKQTLRNELGEVWDISVGEDLPETVTIVAQSSSVWSVLSELAELCETEWWADKKSQSLNLSKCEHGVSIMLEVGKDVKVPTSVRSAEEYFTRFYAFGSSRNITQMDSVVQGSIVNKRLTLDPVKYPEGYKDIKGHFEGGRYVSDLTPEEVLVKSLYFEDVYPSSPLTISSVRKRMRYRLDENDNKIRKGGSDDSPIYEQYAIWYFKVADFEFTEDLIIEGFTLSVAFKSGQLRGREFELAYHPEDRKVADNADVDKDFSVQAGEYEIMFDESDGIMIPSADYLVPSDRDEVTLFNIEMPEEYTQVAYIKLEEELDKEIARLTRDNNAYEFESNPVEFYNNDTSVHLGQRVTFVNEGKELSTRVQMIEKHLDYPCEQKIRIGNEIVKGSRQQLRDDVRNVGEEVNRMTKKGEYYGTAQRGNSRDLMLTMGRFYAMQDTIDMLQGAVEGYTEGINPITVETMAMLVGNEALQFKFTRSTSDFNTIQCPLVYDPAVKKLYAGTCALFHLTLGINEIASVRDVNDYKSWTMEAWQSEIFDDPKKRYYVYAKVEKDGMLGTYVCSETTIGMEQYGQYYHLLVGILNAEYVETREFLPLYGFTQILPGQITTDVIRSADGETYFDLAEGEIGGRILFKSGSSNKELSSWAGATDASLASKASTSALNSLEKSLGGQIEDIQTDFGNLQTDVNAQIAGLQDQIDGVIETWFYDDEPTLNNAPAKDWNTTEAKENHVGDLYYSGAGKAYRWQKNANGAYYWNPIADEDIAKALENAKTAQDTADNKRRVFTSTPSAPYDNGDLWTDGTDLRVCTSSRTSGYSYSDWKLATDYTNDTKAQQALDGLAEAIKDIEKAQTDAINASAAAANAATVAANAQSAAEEASQKAKDAEDAASAAKDMMDSWLEDGVFSKTELASLKAERARVQAEYNEVSTSATNYGINAATYRTAYGYYNTELNKVITALGSSETTNSANLASYQESYYNALKPLLAEIAAAAKAVADDAAEEAERAKQEAEEAKAKAEAAEEAANAAQEAANALTDMIDSDNYLTEIEKQSIRRTMAEITECQGTLLIDTAVITTQMLDSSQPWVKVTKGDVAVVNTSTDKVEVSQDKYIGYYGSNLHVSGNTVMRFKITANKDFKLKTELLVDSYLRTIAYGAVGALNKSITPQYSSANHGTGQDKVTYTYVSTIGNKVNKDFDIKLEEATQNYVEVSYYKSSNIGITTTPYTDSAYVKLLNDGYTASDGTEHIIELNGSFHRYYLLLMQLGYDAIATELANKLQHIFHILDDADVWKVGTTEIADGYLFRADLNAALTDYYAILAACGWDVMDAKIHDLDYLVNAMRNGNTIVEGGLVMTSLVAVGDTSDVNSADVDAFLNGSDFAEDPEHGKLILSGGIPKKVIENGTEYSDLEKRAKEAATKIYEDGYMKTRLLELLDGCKIGDIEIVRGGLKVTLADGGTSGELNLWSGGLLSSSIGGAASLGASPSAAIQSYSKNAEQSSPTNVNAAVLAEGTDSEYAFYSRNGKFAGLRPNIQFLTGTNYLDAISHTVVMPTGTLYLPSNPCDGQEYKIIHFTTSSVTIRVQGSSNIWDFKNATSGTNVIESTAKETIELIYYAANSTWYANKY